MKFKKSKLTLYIGAVFVFFALITVSAGLVNRNSYKRAIIMSRLAGYIELVNPNTADPGRADPRKGYAETAAVLPPDVRMTVIGKDGNVIFDSEMRDTTLENHLGRPEVRQCLRKGEGYSIRRSDSDSKQYFYYARMLDGQIVRMAQDFNVDIAKFFRTDWTFVLLVVVLLLFSLFMVVFLSERLGREEEERADRETRRLKHQMTGNISHELKTPVSSIQGYLETIVNHPELDEERKRTFIERSYLQSVRLSDIIRDISTITKLEEAPEMFDLSPVNLKLVFEEVLDEMSSAPRGLTIQVENELQPVCVHGSYQLIYAIFRNLLENSVKYAGEGATVRVSSSVEGHSYTVDYYDTGRGVPESELDNIFERFYRLNADRSKSVGGSGLGLSIVRNAVLFHHGSIRAWCVPGGGLGFTFTLEDM